MESSLLAFALRGLRVTKRTLNHKCTLKHDWDGIEDFVGLGSQSLWRNAVLH